MDLSFTIAVNSEKSIDELMEIIVELIPNAVRNRGYIHIFPNVLKFEDNFDYNPDRCDEKESGWEYYRYDCDVFPVKKTTLVNQQDIAATLLEIFKGIDAQTEFLAGFEVPK